MTWKREIPSWSLKFGRMSIRRRIMNKQVKAVKHWHQVFTLAEPQINNADTNMRKRNRLCNRTLKVLATSPPTNRRVSLPAGRAETIPQSIFDICGTVISFFCSLHTLASYPRRLKCNHPSVVPWVRLFYRSVMVILFGKMHLVHKSIHFPYEEYLRTLLCEVRIFFTLQTVAQLVLTATNTLVYFWCYLAEVRLFRAPKSKLSLNHMSVEISHLAVRWRHR